MTYTLQYGQVLPYLGYFAGGARPLLADRLPGVRGGMVIGRPGAW